MHRLWYPVIAVAVLLAVLMSGCSKAKEAADTAQAVGQAVKAAKDMERKGEATIKTDDGEATIKINEKDGETSSVSVTNKEGETSTITSGTNVDASKAGIELYPGAEQKGGGDVTGDQGTVVGVTLETTDSFDKVAKFYKDKYPEASKTETSSDGSNMLLMQISQPPDAKTVTVTSDKDSGKVNIVVARNTEKETKEAK